MKIVKVYDKSFSPLTEFLEGEFDDLAYDNKIGEIGSCSFKLQTKNDKVTEENIRHFNRLEIYEDGECQFVGFINSKKITLDVAEIRGLQLAGILRKRLFNGTINDTVPNAMANVINTINGVEDTGIEVGTITSSASVNITIDNQDAYSALVTIAEKAGVQFMVNNDRELVADTQLGTDKSASINVLYNELQPEQSTLLSFEVDDDGSNIVTRAKGKASALSSTQNNTTLQDLYGILEAFSNQVGANNQANLDALVTAQIKDRSYSPKLDLNPIKVPDTFQVGDTVNIDIRSKLVAISGNYQVLQKSVKIQGTQKLIMIRTTSLKPDFVTEIKKIQTTLKRLETKI